MGELTATINEDSISDPRWRERVAELEDLPRYKMSDALLEKARESRGAGESAMEALYIVLGGICSYHYDGADPLEPYGPFIILTTGRSAMPSDLRGSDLDALAVMVSAIAVASLRARVADVLWIRRRDHTAARAAVEAYVEASKTRGEHWQPESLDQLERAMQIVALLGKGGVELRDAPVNAALELLAEEPPLPGGYEIRLVRLLVSWGVKDGLQAAIDRATSCVDKAEADGDQNQLRGSCELVSICAQALGAAALSREYREKIAESWVKEAEAAIAGDNPSHMRAVGLLEFAIKEYRSIGACQARVDELHRTMLGWQSHISGEMQSFSTTVDLTEVVKESVARVSGKALPQAIVGMALVHGFRDVNEIRAEVDKLMDGHPLQYLFSRSQLDEKGRVVARPASIGGGEHDDRTAAVSAEMDSQFMSTIGLVVHGGVEPARRALVLEHAVRLDECGSLLAPSPFIPPGHENTYVRGLWFGLRGDYATAAQVLAPEVENALREQMVQAGAVLPRLNDDVTQAERSLNVVLDHEKAEEVFGANKLFVLKALLISPFGANLRNRIAHGLAGDAELMSAASAYLWWLALRLAVEPFIFTEKQPSSAAEASEPADSR
jgi:hypothetical protein